MHRMLACNVRISRRSTWAIIEERRTSQLDVKRPSPAEKDPDCRATTLPAGSVNVSVHTCALGVLSPAHLASKETCTYDGPKPSCEGLACTFEKRNVPVTVPVVSIVASGGTPPGIHDVATPPSGSDATDVSGPPSADTTNTELVTGLSPVLVIGP